MHGKRIPCGYGPVHRRAVLAWPFWKVEGMRWRGVWDRERRVQSAAAAEWLQNRSRFCFPRDQPTHPDRQAVALAKNAGFARSLVSQCRVGYLLVRVHHWARHDTTLLLIRADRESDRHWDSLVPLIRSGTTTTEQGFFLVRLSIVQALQLRRTAVSGGRQCRVRSTY